MQPSKEVMDLKSERKKGLPMEAHRDEGHEAVRTWLIL